MLNIRDICKHSDSKFWRGSGEHGTRVPAWQRIVFCMIFDGLDAMDKEVLDVLALLGIYQDGIMRREIDGKETVAHIFEFTTQLTVDPGDGTPRLVMPGPSSDKKTDNVRWSPIPPMFADGFCRSLRFS